MKRHEIEHVTSNKHMVTFEQYIRLISNWKSLFSRGIQTLVEYWNTCTERNADHVEQLYAFVTSISNKQCKNAKKKKTV